MQQAADSMVAPTWTAAWAAVATAMFAIAQIVREVWRDKVRGRTANAHSEAIAYEVRRQPWRSTWTLRKNGSSRWRYGRRPSTGTCRALDRAYVEFLGVNVATQRKLREGMAKRQGVLSAAAAAERLAASSINAMIDGHVLPR